MDLLIRKANINDLDIIMDIYHYAQEFMARTGNPNQWGQFHPKKELIIDDIKKGISNVVIDKDNNIYGVFALIEGIDPTYNYIEDGKWLNDQDYLTIHRIASNGKIKGIFKFVINYCLDKTRNIRIDTHKDNIVMQNALKKEGFVKCGIIYLENGDPRIAYQLVK